MGYANLGCHRYEGAPWAGSVDLTGTSAAKMSPAECLRLSSSYPYFGLVGGDRCIGFGTFPELPYDSLYWDPNAPPPPACSVPCTGASSARCGGKAEIQLYARNKPLPQRKPVASELEGAATAQHMQQLQHVCITFVKKHKGCVFVPSCQVRRTSTLIAQPTYQNFLQPILAAASAMDCSNC